jgi:hypothetical protein
MRETRAGSGRPAGARSPQIPHIADKKYAVVSCHVETPLDDRAWRLFSAFQAVQPGGFRIAALMRPPHEGEDGERWLERAREAAASGPLGHHTHWTGPSHARPTMAGTAGRVREEAAWLREGGLEPRLFCGGGWYMDQEVAEVLAVLGYVDCTATAFRPAYLAEGAPRIGLEAPTWLAVGGGRLLELPSTHSLGMAARAALGRLPGHVHVYFHDTDLLSPSRRLALAAALEILGRRRAATDLEALAAAVGGTAPERDFASLVESRS